MSSIELVAKLFTEGKITQDEFLQLIKDLNEKTQVVINPSKDPGEGSPNTLPYTNPYPFTPSIPYVSPGDQPWRYPIVTYAIAPQANAICGGGQSWILHSTL